MNRYTLLQKLEKTKKIVFTPQDLKRIAKIQLKSAYVLINRMKESQQIYSVYKGKFSLTDDPILIATQLYQPTYFSLTTALYLHNRFSQMIQQFFIITSKNIHSPRRILNKYKINFIRIKPKLIFGYRKIAFNNSYYLLADLEKTVLDALYLPGYCHMNDLISALKEGFDISLMEQYALKMDSEAVISRLGILLDFLNIPTRLHRSTKTVYKLVPGNRIKGHFNKKWKIYINEDLGVDNE